MVLKLLTLSRNSSGTFYYPFPYFVLIQSFYSDFGCIMSSLFTVEPTGPMVKKQEQGNKNKKKKTTRPLNQFVEIFQNCYRITGIYWCFFATILVVSRDIYLCVWKRKRGGGVVTTLPIFLLLQEKVRK